MARVTLEQVNKIYPSRHGPVHAVKDLDLTIEDGEFVALLGPSGCGKTSTLRMIVGLEDITGGTIAFDGQPINAATPEMRNVAMAFESYALYPNFTVAQNLRFPLEIKGVDRADQDRKLAEIARLLRIDDILEMRPRQLSGGQQQRVSLGRALIRDPAAFILDEVMSHLDAHLKFRMLFELREIHQRIGRTMVYVTHDQMEALALADRVAVMSNAVLQQIGTRDQLYDTPANMFVADFIGEPPTNFLRAAVRQVEDRLVLETGGGEFRFEPDGARSAAIASRGLNEVVVGIRPQNLMTEPAGPDLPGLEATVELNEYLGEQTILNFSSRDGTLRALAPPDIEDRPGDRRRLFYRREDVMVFDTATEAFVI